MNKKGSMELSVNSIVILVIAIVMLGLILGFVKTKFGDISKGLAKEEPEPGAASSSNQLVLSRSAIEANAGEQVPLKVSYFNTASTDPTAAYSASVSCVSGTTTTALTVSGTSKIAKAQQPTTYTVILTIPTTYGKGYYACSTSINSVSADFTLHVI